MEQHKFALTSIETPRKGRRPSPGFLVASGALVLLICAVVVGSIPIPVSTSGAPSSPSDQPSSTQPVISDSSSPAPPEKLGKLVGTCAVEPFALCITDADGRNPIRITPGAPTDQYVSPRWSPDGTAFAVIRRFTDNAMFYNASKLTLTEVHLIGADGQRRGVFGAQFAITPNYKSYQLDFQQVVWSPDGRRLAVLGVPDIDDSEALDEIIVIDRTEFEATQGRFDRAFARWTLHSPSPDEGNLLAWSSNSRWLAYVRMDPQASGSPRSDVWVFDTQDQRSRLVASGGHVAWIPGSERLSFVGDEGRFLDVIDVAAGYGGARTQLVNERLLWDFLRQDDPWLPPGRLSIGEAAWSPDGSTIAFRVWGKADEPWPKYFPGMLFTLRADGSDLRRWPDTDTPNTSLPVWSPNGRYLAYPYWLAGNGRYHPNATTPAPERRWTYASNGGGLIIVDTAQSTYRDLPSLGQPIGWTGTWSPDSSWLATRMRNNVVLVGITDTAQQHILLGLEPNGLAWQPRP